MWLLDDIRIPKASMRSTCSREEGGSLPIRTRRPPLLRKTALEFRNQLNQKKTNKNEEGEP